MRDLSEFSCLLFHLQYVEMDHRHHALREDQSKYMTFGGIVLLEGLFVCRDCCRDSDRTIYPLAQAFMCPVKGALGLDWS